MTASPPASVRLSISVALDPDTAFEVFTEEIDSWYRRGPHNFADPARTVGIRFEPGVGGRLIEVYDASTGEGLTAGEIVVWEPGRRLVFVDNRKTEVDVLFEPDGDAATGSRSNTAASNASSPTKRCSTRSTADSCS